MDIRNFLDNMNSSAKPLTEALSGPAFEFLEKADQKFRWGYVPEKEYDGKRAVVLELDDNTWVIAMFAEGNAAVASKVAAKKAPAAAPEEETKTEGKNSVKEMLRLMNLSEQMFSGEGVKNNGNYRLSLNEANIPTLTKIDGPGTSKMQNWFFVDAQKYDFENCLKRCVEIVTGQPVDGGVQTLGMMKM